MKTLWNDDGGGITTIELLIYGTIAGLGIIVGVASLRNAVNVMFVQLAKTILTPGNGAGNGDENGEDEGEGGG